ncbi:MAG: hypothetical protein JJE17_08265 [Peptostreptococcaceae bacterium]|nr:hypothetical protein [Peptostreptococcaceae bacterium]
MINIKKIAVDAVKYKKELSILLNSLDAADVEQGLLILKASLLTRDFKSAVLSKAGDLLNNYDIDFINGSIQITASLNAKQLGPVDVDYQINIQELRFDETGHKLYATFKEAAIPNGNMGQKLAVKAALMNGPLLKTAVNLSKVSFAYVDGNNILIDFDKFDFTEKLPASLSLSYVSAKNSKLTFSFNI